MFIRRRITYASLLTSAEDLQETRWFVALVSHGIDDRQRTRVSCPISRLLESASSSLTPVDVERLAGDKCGPFEVEDPVDDIADFTEPAQRMKVRHTRIGGGVVPRPDYAQSDRVHPNPA